MTKSGHAARTGSQLPRIESVPEGDDHPDTEAALELVAAAGILLDPWQERVFRRSLRRKDSKWAAFEIGLVCPRQNGKNELIVARELAGLYVLGERLQIHSAHRFDTSIEAFRRLRGLIQNHDWLLSEVKHFNGKPVGIRNSHGEEGIELENGARIGFRTRVKGGGRGFTADTLYFDEAMELPEETHGALVPTLSARPDPQIWYTGSAVDQLEHDHGIVLARVRARGVAGNDPTLAYFEWSLGLDNPDLLTAEMAADSASAIVSNPALGIRISWEHIEKEIFGALSRRKLAVERYCVGDWPATDEFASAVIDPRVWADLADQMSAPADKSPLIFAFDVGPDRSRASIAIAAKRADDLTHIEVLPRQDGIGWLPAKLAELVAKHKPAIVVTDSVGPAASLLPELTALGVQVRELTSTEHADACGMIFDASSRALIRHRGTPELADAIKGAVKRPLGDRWAWSRKNSHVDITPLVACTFALWGVSQAKPRYRSAGFN